MVWPLTPGNWNSSPNIESIIESRVQSTVQSRVQCPGFVLSLLIIYFPRYLLKPYWPHLACEAPIYWCTGRTCVVQCAIYWSRWPHAVSNKAKQDFKVNPYLLCSDKATHYITHRKAGRDGAGSWSIVNFTKGCQTRSFFLHKGSKRLPDFT